MAGPFSKSIKKKHLLEVVDGRGRGVARKRKDLTYREKVHGAFTEVGYFGECSRKKKGMKGLAVHYNQNLVLGNEKNGEKEEWKRRTMLGIGGSLGWPLQKKNGKKGIELKTEDYYL